MICTRPISQPLAATPPLRAMIETGARVRNVARDGIDKVVSRGRGDHPFALAIDEGERWRRASISRARSSTHREPGPTTIRLATSGTPAIGEITFADRIAYGVPDVLGRDRAVYAGPARARHRRRAFGRQCPARPRAARRNGPADPNIWAVRAANLARVFGGGAADKLRGARHAGRRSEAARGQRTAAARPALRRGTDRTPRRWPRGDGARRRGRAHAWTGGPDRRLHRPAPRPCDDARAAPRPRPVARKRPHARPDDRSEPAFLRHRCRRTATASSRIPSRILRGRHQELWPRADVPDGDRL